MRNIHHPDGTPFTIEEEENFTGLTRIRNGKRYALSDTEKTEIESEWTANEAAQAAAELIKQSKKDARNAAITKLATNAGMTEEEIRLLLN